MKKLILHQGLLWVVASVITWGPHGAKLKTNLKIPACLSSAVSPLGLADKPRLRRLTAHGVIFFFSSSSFQVKQLPCTSSSSFSSSSSSSAQPCCGALPPQSSPQLFEPASMRSGQCRVMLLKNRVKRAAVRQYGQRAEVLFHSSLENALEQASKEKKGKHPFTAQTVQHVCCLDQRTFSRMPSG